MTIRIILDTSIYGKIIEDGVEDNIIEKTNIHKHDMTIYGLKIIRSEIKAAPKHSKDRYDLRFALLRLYDSLTQDHELTIKPLAHVLATLYYKYYRKTGGSVSWSKMMNDMIIVAEATISKLDIVVSDDNRTMLSEPAKKAYFSVNKEHNLITPNFIGYSEFKKKLL
ncbi:MAG TPA: hypothetical protein VJB05_00020 [archaeon]|nr:hypothetical protein [archaeon]